MVIRDLTLRSAASFGSFHLIRLLYDEYMFYLVEHRVAQATGETPIAVMGEVRIVYSLVTNPNQAACKGALLVRTQHSALNMFYNHLCWGIYWLVLSAWRKDPDTWASSLLSYYYPSWWIWGNRASVGLQSPGGGKEWTYQLLFIIWFWCSCHSPVQHKN